MKKSILLICTLAISVATFAVAPRVTKLSEASKAHAAQVVTLTKEVAQPASFKSVEAREDETKVDTVYLPYYVPGTFHYGTPSSGILYYGSAYVISPYAPGVIFYNLANFESTWLVADQEVAKDTALIFPFANGYGEYYTMPVMQTPNYVTETSEYFFPDHQYGQKYIADVQATYPTEDLSDMQGVINSSCYLMPLTYSAVYTENEAAWYFPWDWGTYGASAGGDYWYGTKRVNNYTSTDEKTTYLDTTFVLVTNPGTMLIDHVSLGVWTRGSAGGKSMFPAEDDHIRLTLYPLDNSLNIDWANPIATAKAGVNEYVGAQNAQSWYGILNFNFMTIDPVTGAETQTMAIVNGNFAAVLDEYNDGTAAFGFLCDDEMTDVSRTFFYYTDPTTNTPKITQAYKTPANLLLNFYALLPSVANAPEVVEFELGGSLEKVITLSTNTWGEDYEFESDEDWIDAEAETVYDTDENHTYAVKLKISVTASNEPREGILYVNADAYEFAIVVKQGEVTAVDNVTIKNHDNKLYNVLGIEVGEDYKGVVIRNGEKFIK